MIPKKIHMFWYGSKEYPASVQSCIDSWRKHMPDYEIKVWNYENFPRGKSVWVDQAIDNRKYAFAADYVRLYALYHEGGLYFDTDVEAVKSFDPLMQLPYFVGYENGSGYIDCGTLAAEPHNPFFKAMLDYYDNKHYFENEDGTLNCRPIPWIMMDVVREMKYKIHQCESIADFDHSPDTLSIFSFDYFSPKHQKYGTLESTPRTMAIHHFAGSWITGRHKYTNKIKRLLGPRITEWLFNLKSVFED